MASDQENGLTDRCLEGAGFDSRPGRLPLSSLMGRSSCVSYDTERTTRPGRSRAGVVIGSAFGVGPHFGSPDLLKLPPLPGGPSVEVALRAPGPGRSRECVGPRRQRGGARSAGRRWQPTAGEPVGRCHLLRAPTDDLRRQSVLPAVAQDQALGVGDLLAAPAQELPTVRRRVLVRRPAGRRLPGVAPIRPSARPGRGVPFRVERFLFFGWLGG